ncbi:hypothetical protein VTN77DRAFT_3290 [Rasamsonia byssochlamydoides]|uniref:uncharacterized protein n=1 Tax=Rasamsonia byssochlamydoides TaxID=89139 RepID=UPI003743D696
MSKRCRDDEQADSPPSKRHRGGEVDQVDRLSALSDEILLHILSFLPIPSLIVCQRLSRRFHALAGDSELWKRQYFSRWVLPRARRLPYFKHPKFSSGTGYSPKVSKWLGHSHLAEDGKVTHWKTQYRIRHNWSKGTCRVREVEVAQLPPPPVLVGFHSGFVFTADMKHGLRAWSIKYHKTYLASVSFLKSEAVPSALSATQGSSSSSIEVTVGFEDGTFDVYDLDVVESKFILRYSNVTSTAGAVTAIASSPPYLLMVSQNKVLSLYKSSPRATSPDKTVESPRLLASLEANNILAPMSLSIRSSASEIIASIAYNFYHIGCGWSIGIQELHISHDGEHLSSRLATTIDSQYSANMQTPIERTKTKRPVDSPYSTISSNPSIRHNEPPTSLSYSHPYLLTSHKDNTLTMYLVVSSSDKLAIKGARRLWGHTSSVSGVQVSDRGKAVSVSSRGNEIRIWELETVISSPSASRRALKGESSVQIIPENKSQRNPFEFRTMSEAINWGRQELRREPEDAPDEAARMGGWVGFDDEQVVVLRERGRGTQLLECYDFT